MSGTSLIDALDNIQDGGSSQYGPNPGYFCKVTIESGYKVYAAGMDHNSSFFPFDPANERTAQVALERAKAFVVEHGVSSNPSKSIALTLHRETVKNRQVTWQRDMTKIVATWTPAYKDVWKPAFKKIGISKMGSYWAHVILVNDPSGRTEKMQKRDGSGEMDVPSKVWVVDEIYPNEGACEKAAEKASVDAPKSEETEEVPAGYTAAMWAKYKDDITKELDGSDAAFEKVAAEWSMPIDFLRRLYARKK